MSDQLELQQVEVRYGSVRAVKGVSMRLEKGEIGCLLGPSGCGKTTLLRAIAGFEPLFAGEIKINGIVKSSATITIPPEQRKVGMVFQDFALFPHLKVDRNVGFGLSRHSGAERQQRVLEMLELVGLTGHAKSYPHELSGGQQQRVALARALAPSPDLLLLDEPFSSLDSELREQLAAEVRQILKQNDITAMLVTHDQQEAFAVADQITVLQEGRVSQADTPFNLYYQPANEFVASFIGKGSIVTVQVDSTGELENGLGVLKQPQTGWTPQEKLRLLLRPDDIAYAPGGPLALTVTARSFRGAHYLYELELADGQRVTCLTPSHIEVAVADKLPVDIDLRQAVVLQRSAQG